MKTIGLIGGTSWESTAVYYRLLNEGVRGRLGGLASASLVLVSLDFAPLAAAMADNRWADVEAVLTAAARQLEAAGAMSIGLCTNTMHKLAGSIGAATALPFVDIREVTGQALCHAGVRRPLLLATRYTMEEDFYRDHLHRHFGLDIRIPDQGDRDCLQGIIFDELCQGRIVPQSRAAVLAMVAKAATEGCDGLVFGCTEIGLLLSQADSALPVFDTTSLHCTALLDGALSTPHTMSQAA